jgi:iron complex transport system substrate-binding protein
MSLSRRRFLFGTAVLATTVAGLSACNASAGSDSTTGDAAPPAAAPGVEEGAYPVTIEHKWGSTTIDSARQRVVVAGYKEQDDCLALGVVPVATTAWFDLGGSEIVGPWATAALGDPPQPTLLKDADGINLEAIAGLAPDLIISIYSGLAKADYARLSEIAPTIAQPKDGADWSVSWDVQATMVGQALGRPRQMTALIEDAKKKVAEAAAANPEFARATGAAVSAYEGIWVYGAEDPRSRLLTDLGFQRPAGLDAAIGGQWGGDLSDEKVDLLDVGALIWLYEGTGRQPVEANKAYASQAVHTQGRDLFSGPGDGMYEAFSFLTVLSLGYLVDKLVPRLKNAVDGDPSTSTDQA